jgi:hypothetical protein
VETSIATEGKFASFVDSALEMLDPTPDFFGWFGPFRLDLIQYPQETGHVE